jgi:hypothetical protein
VIAAAIQTLSVVHVVRAVALLLALIAMVSIFYSWMWRRHEHWVQALFVGIELLLLSSIGRLIYLWSAPLEWYGAPLIIVAAVALIYYSWIRRASGADSGGVRDGLSV